MRKYKLLGLLLVLIIGFTSCAVHVRQPAPHVHHHHKHNSYKKHPRNKSYNKFHYGHPPKGKHHKSKPHPHGPGGKHRR